MSWPLNSECPVCFKTDGWHAKYTSEKNRCKCDEAVADEQLTDVTVKDLGNGHYRAEAA